MLSYLKYKGEDPPQRPYLEGAPDLPKRYLMSSTHSCCSYFSTFFILFFDSAFYIANTSIVHLPSPGVMLFSFFFLACCVRIRVSGAPLQFE